MKTEININKMTIQDLNNLESTLTTEFDDFWKFSILKQEFLNTTSHLFVAKSNNTTIKNDSEVINEDILGFISVQFILDEACITNIVTKKQSRRLGIGSALLEFIINYSKTNNMSSIILEVNEKNIPALNLYKKFNFEQIGLRKNYYNGSDNAIIMKLSI